MNISDYLEKLEGMIDKGVKKSTYKKTEDTTLQDLKKFQYFFTGTSIQICLHIIISLQNYMEQLKHTYSTTFTKLTKKK